jgi:hypothetical protein
MKTAFIVEQFFGIFKKYNEAIFPMQILLYLLSIIALYLLINPAAKTSRIIAGILAFLWLWMGVVYHLAFFTRINNAAYLFGAVFILQGILLLFFAVLHDKISFRLQPGVYGITGIIFILFALIIYPVLGYFLGHVYPGSPTFGLPCPTTIFTFGLLLLSEKKLPFTILIIPFTWSVIGFTAALKFGVKEDIALLFSGLVTLAMTVIRNRQYKIDRTHRAGKSWALYPGESGCETDSSS